MPVKFNVVSHCLEKSQYQYIVNMKVVEKDLEEKEFIEYEKVLSCYDDRHIFHCKHLL